MKINKPKFKIVYRSRENIWGKFNNVRKLKTQKWGTFVKKLDKHYKKNFIRKARSLKLIYKQRLINKQKFKSFYGNMSYIILKKTYNVIKQKNSFNVIDRLIISLEKRLDVFLYRTGLYSSIFEAKQAINHKKVKVNNCFVLSSNFNIQEGDYIETPFTKKINFLPYIHVNTDLSLIILLRDPKIQEIKYPFNLNKRFLCEYLNTK